MQIKVSELCELLNGQPEGNAELIIDSVSKIEEGQPGALSFLANPKYEAFLYETLAGAVLVHKGFVPAKEVKTTVIRVEDLYTAFTTLLNPYFGNLFHKTGIEDPSFVSSDAKMGDDVYVGAFSYIGRQASIGNNVKIYPNCYVGDGVRIGDDTILYSGVKIYALCEIGKDCIIHSGTVIGSDGFGFAPQSDGSYSKIPQTGNVVVEDRVEIGSNCSIDRATMGSTRIRKGAKLDNLIQIAHSVEIGANTVIAA